MGEIAEMMLDGTMCQVCGEFIDFDGEPAGYPVTCGGCKSDDAEPEFVGDLRDPRTIVCGYGKTEEFTGCQRMFRGRKDLRQHRRDKHG